MPCRPNCWKEVSSADERWIPNTRDCAPSRRRFPRSELHAAGDWRLKKLTYQNKALSTSIMLRFFSHMRKWLMGQNDNHANTNYELAMIIYRACNILDCCPVRDNIWVEFGCTTSEPSCRRYDT